LRRGVHRPPRFRSRVFSTPQRFPGTPGDRGLVSCRSRPWGFPFRALLLGRGRVRLSASLAPLQLVTVVPERRCSRPHPPGFTDARALARWPGSTPELDRRFRRGEPRLPRRSGSRSPGSARSDGFVCFEALLPPRGRSIEGRLPATRPPLLSWASPLQSLAPTEPRDLITLRPCVRPQQAGVCDDVRCYRASSGETATTSRSRRPRRRAITPERPEHARAASRRHLCLPRPWRG